MANGKSSRWHAETGGPKHLVVINGESLLERIVRQLAELKQADIIITSGNPAYTVYGAKRHEPASNKLELDRFTTELIRDDCCFLYGDTFYTDAAMETIVEASVNDVIFAGNAKSIVAVIIKKKEPFLQAISKVRNAIKNAELTDGKGWHVYSAHVGQSLTSRDISKDFLMVDGICNINTVADYYELLNSFD